MAPVDTGIRSRFPVFPAHQMLPFFSKIHIITYINFQTAKPNEIHLEIKMGFQTRSGEQQWVQIDCGQAPGEGDCQLVIRAPESQRDDLIRTAAAHAVQKHGMSDSPELRTALAGLIRPIQV